MKRYWKRFLLGIAVTVLMGLAATPVRADSWNHRNHEYGRYSHAPSHSYNRCERGYRNRQVSYSPRYSYRSRHAPVYRSHVTYRTPGYTSFTWIW